MKKLIVYILVVLLVSLNLTAMTIATWEDSNTETFENNIDNLIDNGNTNAELDTIDKDSIDDIRNPNAMNEKIPGISNNQNLYDDNFGVQPVYDNDNVNVPQDKLIEINENLKNSNLGFLFKNKNSNNNPLTYYPSNNEQPLAHSGFSQKNVKVNNEYGTDNQYQPSVTIGPTTNNIYVVWIDTRWKNAQFVYFASSSDGGNTFEVYSTVNEDGNAEAPQIVADKNEALHVVWYDDRDGDEDIWYSKSTDNGLTWRSSLCVNQLYKPTNQTNPAIALNNSFDPPIIWVAWQDTLFVGNDTHDGIVLSFSANGGNSFISPKEVYTNKVNDYSASNPDIGVDELGHVWIVWNEGRSGIDDQNIYFTRTAAPPEPGLVDPTFNFTSRVDDAPVNTNQTQPVIAVFNNTIAYTAWQDERANLSSDIYFARYLQSSNNFTSNIKINTNPDEMTNQMYPAMALNYTNGHIYITWPDGRNGYYENYFAKSTNGGVSFSNEILIDDDFTNNNAIKKISPSTQKNIVIDTLGDLLMVYSENRYGNHDIFYQESNDYGTSWSKSMIVNENSTEGIQRSLYQYQIVIGQDETIHVVWEDTGAKNVSVSSEIFYAQSIDSGLTFTPSVLVNYKSDGVQKNPSVAINDSWIFVSWTEAPDIAVGGEIYFSYSTDGGKTFEYDILSQTNLLVNGITTDNDHSQIAVNASGEVFIAYHGYNDQPPRQPSNDIFVAYSFYNASITRFNPFLQVGVNNDSSALPFPVEQFNPAIAIDIYDNIFIAFEDDRNQSKSGYDIFMAPSNTSALTFPDNYKVNDEVGDTHETTTEHKHPSIAINITSNISVVWHDDRSGNFNVYFSKSVDGGNTFTQDQRIHTNTVNDKMMPIITIGLNNNIYVTWQDNRNGDWDIYMTKSTDTGTTFQAEVRVDDDSTNADQQNPSIALNDTGGLYIVWTDSRGYHTDINNKVDYYITRSADDGTTFNKSYCVHSYQGEPVLAVDDTGVVYVVWTDHRFGKWDIMFAKSTTGGQYFENNFPINTNSTNSRGKPDIAIRGKELYIVWEDAYLGENNKTIMFCKSTDGGITFGPNVDISLADRNQQDPAIVVDKDGVAHVVWQNYFDQNRQTLHYANSTDWNARMEVFSAFAQLNIWRPCIAINDGQQPYKIFVAFENRSNPNDWNISFTRSIDGGNSFQDPPLDLNDFILFTKQAKPAIDADANGNLAIVWQDRRAFQWDIYGDFSTDNGTSFGGLDTLINGTLFDEEGPDVLIDRMNSSSILVIYQSANGTTPNRNHNIYVTVSSDGGSTFDFVLRVDDTDSEFQNQISPKITTNGQGSYYAVWEDYRHGNADIYFNMTDNTPPIADAGPDIYIDQGYAANFLANRSWDNVGLASYNWSFNDNGIVYLNTYSGSHVFNDPRDYLVTLTVEDHNGYQTSDTLWVYVRDLSPPSFGLDSSGVNAFTGNSYTFDVIVTDNAGVDVVQVSYWFGKNNESSNTTVPMAPFGLNQYRFTIPSVPHTFEYLYYKFSTNDTSDNWNFWSGMPKPVYDNDKPDITNDQTPATAYANKSFTFSIDSTDNIKVDRGYVEYWYGSGTHTIAPLTKSGNTYTHNIKIDNTLQTLHYNFSFVDNSTYLLVNGNWNSTSVNDVDIYDDEKPWFKIDNSDTTAYTNKTYKFSIKFGDNIATQSASVEYWFGSGTHTITTLNKVGSSFELEINIPNSLDSLNYNFTIKDTSNNFNTTTPVQVTVIDDTDPMAIKGSEDIPATTGEAFNLHAKFSDNVDIGLVKIYYRKETTTTYNEMEVTTGTNGYYRVTNAGLSIDTTADLTKWEYYFYAEDTSQNSVTWGLDTDPYVISVSDNDKPTANAGSDIEGKEGDTVYFNGNKSIDNIGIVKYKWTFKYDNTDKELSGETPQGFKFDISGDYKVTLEVSDAADNTDSDTVNVTIGVIEKPKVILQSPDNDYNTSDTFLKLKWKTTHKSPTLIKYDLYFGTDEDPKLKESDLTVTEYEITDLEDKTTYYWTVKAKLGTIKGDKAPVRHFNVDFEDVVYGVALESDKNKLVITVGDEESLTLTIKNTGTTIDTITLSMDKGDFPNKVELEKDELNVQADESFDIKLTVDTTKTTPISNFTITITAQSNNDATKSASVDIDIQTIPEEKDKDKDDDNLPDKWELDYWDSIEDYDGDDDPDNDGLTNKQEYDLGSDPTVPEEDKDGDKLPDTWELEYWDPIEKYGANDDPDEDGLTNKQEFEGKTNPMVKEDGKPPDGDGDDKEADNTAAIAAAVAVIIIIIVLLLLFMMMKKKGGKPEEEEPEEEKPKVGRTPTPPMKPSPAPAAPPKPPTAGGPGPAPAPGPTPTPPPTQPPQPPIGPPGAGGPGQ